MSETTGAHRDRRHLARLAWLRDHPELLARLPAVHEDVTPDQHTALDEALRTMLLVRLYAPTSASDRTRWGIRALVDELRREESAADPRRI